MKIRRARFLYLVTIASCDHIACSRVTVVNLRCARIRIATITFRALRFKKYFVFKTVLYNLIVKPDIGQAAVMKGNIIEACRNSGELYLISISDLMA